MSYWLLWIFPAFASVNIWLLLMHLLSRSDPVCLELWPWKAYSKIKLRKKMWTGCVAHIHVKNSDWNTSKEDYLEDLDKDKMIMIKWISEKQNLKVWSGFGCLMVWPNRALLRNCNKLSGSIKVANILVGWATMNLLSENGSDCFCDAALTSSSVFKLYVI